MPTASRIRPPLGIYLHWPFCKAICPYCDFNVHLASRADPADWLAAYTSELRHAHSLRPDGPVETVFFGGGTPSLMPPDLVAGLLAEIDALWGLAAKAEISLEANPTSAPQAQLTGLRAAGVTRLSLGVQAFDDKALAFLGRTHDAAAAAAAFAAAQRIFPRASFDLIYARPEQSLAGWQAELRAALALGPQHMSLYQLTVEPETPFARLQAAGRLTLPEEGLAIDLYEATQALCAEAGLPAYEISNHAAAGHQCRHNVASWQGGDYLGIGPGAHGRLTAEAGRLATRGLRAPADWLAQVSEKGHGWAETELLSAAETAAELVLLGLRLADGVALADLAARGLVLPADNLAALRAEGFLTDHAERLQASPAGRPVLDALIGRLLAE